MSLTIPDLISITSLTGILVFLASKWTEARITASIKSEYDRKLADYQAELKRREQASRIADLLTRFHYSTEPIIANKQNKLDFMKLAWELSIWLPPDTVRSLSEHLINWTPGNVKKVKDPKTILIEVRKILHGKSDDLLPEQIIHM